VAPRELGNGYGAAGEARRRRLLVLLDDAAAATADGPHPGSDDAVRPAAQRSDVAGPVLCLGRVCALVVPVVNVDGAGATVMGSVAAGIAGRRDLVCASSPLSRHLEDLQLTAGQGPCLDAYAAGAAVLVGDLSGERHRWPGFTPDAIAAGVAAVFSFPLQVGAVRLGTLDLYRSTAGPLERAQLADALVLAGLATEILLEHARAPGGSDPGGSDPGGSDPGASDPGASDPDVAGLDTAGRADMGWLPDVHAEVHQASGMVSVASHTGVGEALVRPRDAPTSAAPRAR